MHIMRKKKLENKMLYNLNGQPIEKVMYNRDLGVTVSSQPRTQAQITKKRHTTVFLYRSVPKMSKRAGVLGEDSTTPARSLSLATDLYWNTVVCLFLVICAWSRHIEVTASKANKTLDHIKRICRN
jgi:hypothetical protein